MTKHKHAMARNYNYDRYRNHILQDYETNTGGEKMQAIRVQPAPPNQQPYSPTNPAPPSCLQLETVPIPAPSQPDDLLVRVKASTVIRDALTWPETYATERAIPGHDFAGVVDTVLQENGDFQPGDEVYGMADAERGSTWAEYTVVKAHETALKPSNLSWEEAAAVPLSALTAYEALFVHAGLDWPPRTDPTTPTTTGTRILVTGSSGAVGLNLIQLCVATQHTVVAASRSLRNEPLLRSLGATDVVEYEPTLKNQRPGFDVIIDTVGGGVLEDCWSWINPQGGRLISVDSASFDFVNEHRHRGLSRGKEGVHALFFIVKSNGPALRELTGLVQSGRVRPFVSEVLGLQQAQQAYERVDKVQGVGKVVLRPG